MTGTLDALFAATLCFVGGHFLLSSETLRALLVRRLGPQGFLIGYSLSVSAAFIWMVAAYGEAPTVAVWFPPAGFFWIPVAVMPVAILLAVAGVTTPNPTLVGAERRLSTGGPETPAPGIISITRHPFLWGTALWAVSHLAVNGDLASIIMMTGILVLSSAGMWHIDRRREAALGAAWGPVKLTTSVIPFAAVLTGRGKPDWTGIGWWRPALALAIYAVLLHLHGSVIGVPAWQG
ncbi:MAG: NnrU family protein [Kiloniellaceae bacterium]